MDIGLSCMKSLLYNSSSPAKVKISCFSLIKTCSRFLGGKTEARPQLPRDRGSQDRSQIPWSQDAAGHRSGCHLLCRPLAGAGESGEVPGVLKIIKDEVSFLLFFFFFSILSIVVKYI